MPLPAKIIFAGGPITHLRKSSRRKKNSPHPTRAPTHLRCRHHPRPPSDRICERGELPPPLPSSPSLPPPRSGRDGACRRRRRPLLASSSRIWEGGGLSLPLPPSLWPDLGGRGDRRRHNLSSLLPPLGWISGEGGAARPAASRRPLTPPARRLAVTNPAASHRHAEGAKGEEW